MLIRWNEKGWCLRRDSNTGHRGLPNRYNLKRFEGPRCLTGLHYEGTFVMYKYKISNPR